jgi:hypothetical protein
MRANWLAYYAERRVQGRVLKNGVWFECPNTRALLVLAPDIMLELHAVDWGAGLAVIHSMTYCRLQVEAATVDGRLVTVVLRCGLVMSSPVLVSNARLGSINLPYYPARLRITRLPYDSIHTPLPYLQVQRAARGTCALRLQRGRMYGADTARPFDNLEEISRLPAVYTTRGQRGPLASDPVMSVLTPDMWVRVAEASMRTLPATYNAQLMWCVDVSDVKEPCYPLTRSFYFVVYYKRLQEDVPPLMFRCLLCNKDYTDLETFRCACLGCSVLHLENAYAVKYQNELADCRLHHVPLRTFRVIRPSAVRPAVVRTGDYGSFAAFCTWAALKYGGVINMHQVPTLPRPHYDMLLYVTLPQPVHLALAGQQLRTLINRVTDRGAIWYTNDLSMTDPLPTRAREVIDPSKYTVYTDQVYRDGAVSGLVTGATVYVRRSHFYGRLSRSVHRREKDPPGDFQRAFFHSLLRDWSQRHNPYWTKCTPNFHCSLPLNYITWAGLQAWEWHDETSVSMKWVWWTPNDTHTCAVVLWRRKGLVEQWFEPINQPYRPGDTIRWCTHHMVSPHFKHAAFLEVLNTDKQYMWFTT